MLNVDIAKLREDYKLSELSEHNASAQPFTFFEQWFNEAINAQLLEPNAMVLSTVDEHSKPFARTVLLKNFSAQEGFTFYTNYDSRKSTHLTNNKNAHLLFAWLPLQRQVHISGIVNKVNNEDSDIYFASRPRQSQLGAWASAQSSIINSREELENNFKKYEQQFLNTEVPRPQNWGGWALQANSIEFWQGRVSRLHDRLLYTKDASSGEWKIERLAP